MQNGLLIFKDTNYSLALLVLAAHQRFKVLALSETYASLPLSKVASLAFPPDTSIEYAEGYIQNLISNHQLPGAFLTQQSPTPENALPQSYLKFLPEGSLARSETELHKELLQQRGKVMVLGTHIRDAQRKLELSKEYVEAVKKARKAETKGQHQTPNTNSTSQIDDDMVADM